VSGSRTKVIPVAYFADKCSSTLTRLVLFRWH
jgi:hypothetical protein